MTPAERYQWADGFAALVSRGAFFVVHVGTGRRAGHQMRMAAWVRHSGRARWTPRRPGAHRPGGSIVIPTSGRATRARRGVPPEPEEPRP